MIRICIAIDIPHRGPAGRQAAPSLAARKRAALLRAPLAGAAGAAAVDCWPVARPEDAWGGGGGGGGAETPEDDTGPRAANAAAAPPAAAEGPERAGTDQPAIIESIWSDRRLASTWGKPEEGARGMKADRHLLRPCRRRRIGWVHPTSVAFKIIVNGDLAAVLWNWQSQVYLDPRTVNAIENDAWPAPPESAPWSLNKASTFADMVSGSTAPSSVQKCNGARNGRSLSAILLKNHGCCCFVFEMRRWLMHDHKHSSNACWTGEQNSLCSTGCWQGPIIPFGVQNPDLRSKSAWIFTWNKGALQKLETNFYFKDLHRVFSLQLSGICMWSWIWNFHSLSWSESDMEYQTVSWKFNVRMGSCYVKTIISLSCSPAILTEPQAREGKLEKFVGESWNIKIMYSFYLNAQKTTSPRVKHFMRVELSLS